MASNPLLERSRLPYETPDFGAIRDEHFAPALDAGLREACKELECIKSNTAPPTFANTVEALELSGQLLARVQRTFLNLCAANSTPELLRLEQAYAPRFAQHRDRVFLDSALYARVAAVYAARASLEGEARRLVEHYHTQFVLAGATLSEADKATLSRLNERAASLQATFGATLLAARARRVVHFDTADALRGLSEDELRAAQANATAAGHDGGYALTLFNTTQQPPFATLCDASARRRLYEASLTRNECDEGELDTRPLLLELVRVRMQKAHLLGHRCFADWKLQDQMASTETAAQLLRTLAEAAVLKARAEAAAIEAYMRAHGIDAALQPWDWVYYAEQLRREQYHFDEDDVRAYFELMNVLEKGVFYAAEQLYGVTLQRRHDLPVYDADMLCYELFDHDGQPLALYVLDPYARPNKRGGAWMTNYVAQSHALRQRPVVHNVLNIPKPASADAPTLLSLRNVITLFHEFGHGLHGMLSDLRYPSLSGTSVARDFLEFPSQINEKWAMHEPVLQHYALHYATHEPMPRALRETMLAAATFSGGFETVELVKAAAIDLHWHTVCDAAEVLPVAAMEAAATTRFALDFALIPPRYGSSYFAHIFQGGYAAGYYAYLWAKLLDCDGFEWLLEHGGLTRANGEHLRRTVLALGNSADANELYERFAGRKPDVAAFLRSRGLA